MNDKNKEPISAIVLVTKYGSYYVPAFRFFNQFFRDIMGINTILVITKADGFRPYPRRGSEQEIIEDYRKTYNSFLHCPELPTLAFDLSHPQDKKKEDNRRDEINRDIFLRLVSNMPHIEKQSDVLFTKPEEMFSANKSELLNHYLMPLRGMMSTAQGVLGGYIDPFPKKVAHQAAVFNQLIIQLEDNSLLEKVFELRSKSEVSAGQLMLAKSQVYTKNSSQSLEFKLELTPSSSYSHYEISFDQKKIQIKDIIQTENTLSGVIESSSSSESSIVISLFSKKPGMDYKLVEKEFGKQLDAEAVFLDNYSKIFSSLNAYVTKWRELAAEKLKENLELHKVDPKAMNDPQLLYDNAIKMIDQFYKQAEALIIEYHHQRCQLLQPKASLKAIQIFLDKHMVAQQAELAKAAAVKADNEANSAQSMIGFSSCEYFANSAIEAAEEARVAAEKAAEIAKSAKTPEGVLAAAAEALEASKAAKMAEAAVTKAFEALETSNATKLLKAVAVKPVEVRAEVEVVVAQQEQKNEFDKVVSIKQQEQKKELDAEPLEKDKQPVVTAISKPMPEVAKREKKPGLFDKPNRFNQVKKDSILDEQAKQDRSCCIQ